MGGGLGVSYQQETPPSPQAYVDALLKTLGGRTLELILEPGRAIVANAGILITQVEYLKTNPHKNFAVVDAGMNDLIRPALYDAWQAIDPVIPHENLTAANYDIVGPVCETGDFLGKNRSLALQPGDLLAVRSAGAYGFAMSSNYNARPRVAEVMVDGDKSYLVRKRETIASLFADESLLPNSH
jgi:diaminopimelate decarboxylase